LESDKYRKAEEQLWLRAHGRLSKRASALWEDLSSQGARARMRQEAAAIHVAFTWAIPVASNRQVVTNEEGRGKTK
jgi:hypothetical protein